MYFDLVVGSPFTFFNGPNWSWQGLPHDTFSQFGTSSASRLKIKQLDLLWNDTVMLSIKIVANDAVIFAANTDDYRNETYPPAANNIVVYMTVDWSTLIDVI